MNAWLSNEPTPDVRSLTLTELLDLWAKNRNSMIGRIAADEVCRRLVAG